MATTGGEDVEYESDPEDVKILLGMRRREASDDEEGVEDGNRRIDRLSEIPSDDSDGQGGVAEYEDDEEYIEDEDEDEVEEEDEVGEDLYKERYDEDNKNGAEGSVAPLKESYNNLISNLDESVDACLENGQDEKKKENEPFAVPTAGSFYMHDDRFRDNDGGRHRRTRGGRRLWESRDDRKWGHDKFEEINLHGRQHKERREASRGSYRGGGRGQGAERVDRGSRTGYNSSNNQSQAPKVLRGRGPRRYEPARKVNVQADQTQKQPRKPLEKTQHASSSGSVVNMSKIESDPVPTKKQVVTSSLSSASPPFYPSGSSNKDNSLTHKRDVQAGGISMSFHSHGMTGSFSVPQANALVRGKNVVESVGKDNTYADNSATTAVGKSLNNLQFLPSGSSGDPHPRGAGRGLLATGRTIYQPVQPQTEGIRRSPAQSPAIQQTSMQDRGHIPPIGQKTDDLSRSSSRPKASVGVTSFESGEVDTAPESSNSKMAIVGKGTVNPQGTGRGSLIYGGAQDMRFAKNMGVSQGDQNFPATPAFLPVMQFGGQHPSGIPAVGMAFPGYVAQRQLGSEMTWLPFLAGAAGALGTSYGSPYLAVDGAYTRQSGQTSSTSVSSKENSTIKSNNETKSSQGPDIVSEELGQRQNKPRRYSEMNFGQ